jgi:hypothetical protein
MSVILFINFGPWVQIIYIDKETKLLLFLYGIIILITSNYHAFENQSILLHSFYDTSANNAINPYEQKLLYKL